MPNPGDFTPTNLEFVINEDQDETYAAIGGDVERYVAGASLNVGDVVYFSAAAGVVNKSTTIANYQTFAGVVVGGRQTGGRALTMQNAVGVLAANVNELVLVMVRGKMWVVSGAAITAPANVSADSTTAGRVLDGAGAVAGQIVGTVLQTVAGAAATTLMQVGHR